LPGRAEENLQTSQDNQPPGGDMNTEPPTYEADVLTIRPRLSVILMRMGDECNNEIWFVSSSGVSRVDSLGPATTALELKKIRL